MLQAVCWLLYTLYTNVQLQGALEPHVVPIHLAFCLAYRGLVR